MRLQVRHTVFHPVDRSWMDTQVDRYGIISGGFHRWTVEKALRQMSLDKLKTASSSQVVLGISMVKGKTTTIDPKREIKNSSDGWCLRWLERTCGGDDVIAAVAVADMSVDLLVGWCRCYCVGGVACSPMVEVHLQLNHITYRWMLVLFATSTSHYGIYWKREDHLNLLVRDFGNYCNNKFDRTVVVVCPPLMAFL
jgi:hypothetical protein